MEEGELQRLLGGGRGLRFDSGAGLRGGEELERLADAVEHQADAHARAEHHGHPGEGGELRFVVVPAEPDPSEAAEREYHGEGEEDVGGDDEEPAEVVQDPAEGGAGGPAEVVLGEDAPGDDPEHRDRADSEDHPVDGEGGGGFVRRPGGLTGHGVPLAAYWRADGMRRRHDLKGIHVVLCPVLVGRVGTARRGAAT